MRSHASTASSVAPATSASGAPAAKSAAITRRQSTDACAGERSRGAAAGCPVATASRHRPATNAFQGRIRAAIHVPSPTACCAASCSVASRRARRLLDVTTVAPRASAAARRGGIADDGPVALIRSGARRTAATARSAVVAQPRQRLGRRQDGDQVQGAGARGRSGIGRPPRGDRAAAASHAATLAAFALRPFHRRPPQPAARRAWPAATRKPRRSGRISRRPSRPSATRRQARRRRRAPQPRAQ